MATPRILKKFVNVWVHRGLPCFPIGAYEPRELMRAIHMNPEDAFHAHHDLQAKCSLAIHYRTFQLTDEDRDAPEHELHEIIKHSSKLINPFYCIREGKRIIV